MIRILLICCAAGAALAADPVVTNGDFQTLDGAWFAGWDRGDPALVTVGEAGDERFLRLVLPEHQVAMIQQRVLIDPSWREVEVGVQIRSSDLVPAVDEAWKTARLEYLFHDADGQHVGGWNDLRAQAGVAGWQRLKATRAVPEGAVELRLRVGAWDAKGTIDFDGVLVRPVSTSD